MPHSLPEPLSTYAHVLVNEFLYEWRFLRETLAGRAQGRADFTDKLVTHLKSVISAGIGKLPLPGASVIEKGLGFAIDWKNDDRKEIKQEHIARLQTIEEDNIRIIVELAALEACKRYQYAILAQLTSDPLKGVIPLAKAGAERMLEYIARNALPIAVPHLVNGLFAGHSGAYVTGFTNTKLALQEEKQNEGYLNKIKRKLGGKGYTAEGVYGRSALRTSQGKLFALGEKKYALHKMPKNSNDKKEAWFNYGYTKFIDKTCDPKYGYMQVNQTIVDQIYGHLKLSQHTLYQSLQQVPQQLSLSLQTQLKTFKPAIVTFNKLDLKNYIAAAREAKLAQLSPLSLFGFIKNNSVQNADMSFLMYEPDSITEYDLSDLDLEGLILDDCSFTHCAFGGSLKKTSLQRCNLQFSNFTRVITAEEINMSNAQCQFANASKLNMKNSKLLQSDWSFADLSYSIIKGSQVIGAIWHQANVNHIQSESQLGIIQANQEKIIKSMQTKLFALQSSFLEKNEEQSKLASEVQALIAVEKKENNKSNLVELMQALHQEKQDRFVQERDCKTELLRLRAKQALQEEQIDVNTQQISQLQTKSQQLEKLISLIETQQKEFDECLSECRQLAKSVLDQKVKLTDLDQKTLLLDERITDIVSAQSKQFFTLNRRLSAVEAAVNELIQEKINIETLSSDAKNMLRYRYQGRKEISGLFGRPFQIESQYINLQMISQDKQKNKEKSEEDKKPDSQFQDARISSYEDLFGSKKTISVKDLFKNQNESSLAPDLSLASNLVLIQGRAGIGKTTFISYVSSEWAKGKLYPEYDWMFVLSLRELRSNTFKIFAEQKKLLAVWEWIYHALFKRSGMSESYFNSIWLLKIEPALRQNKALIVLDGFDEMPEHHPCEIALESLLEGEYASCPLLITSRPYGVGRLPKIRKDIEIIGFTNENIEQYIKTYFNEEKESDLPHPLVSILKTHPTLWGIAHVPVNLNLICGIAENTDQRPLELNNAFGQLQSMTTTYGVMEYKLFERNYIERPNADHRLSESKKIRKQFLFEHYNKERNFLAKLAFLGMQNQQIILPHAYIDNLLLEMSNQNKFNEYNFLQSVRHLGLIKPVIDSSDIQEEQSYEFIHLTFQEYYAAIYISHCLIHKDKIFNDLIKPLISDEKYNQRWKIVWWFVAGLLKEQPQALAMFLDLLQGYDLDIYPKTAFSNDLLSFYELGLLAKCLDECDSALTSSVTSSVLRRIQVMIKNLFNQSMAGLYSDGLYDKKEFYSFFLRELEMSTHLHNKQDNEDLFALCTPEESMMSGLARVANLEFNFSTPKISALSTKLIEKNSDHVFSINPEFSCESDIKLMLEKFILEIVTESKKDISSDKPRDLYNLKHCKLYNLKYRLTEILCLQPDCHNILQKMIELFSHPHVEVRLFSTRLVKNILDKKNENYFEKKHLKKASIHFAINTIKKFTSLFSKWLNDENYNVKINILILLIRCEFDRAVPYFIDMITHLLEETTKKGDFRLIFAISESKKIALNVKIFEQVQNLLSYQFPEGVVSVEQEEDRIILIERMSKFHQEKMATPSILQILNDYLKNEKNFRRFFAVSAIESMSPAALTPIILETLAFPFCEDASNYLLDNYFEPIKSIIEKYPDKIFPFFWANIERMLLDEEDSKIIICLKTLSHKYPDLVFRSCETLVEMLVHKDIDFIHPRLAKILNRVFDEIPESFFDNIANIIRNADFSTIDHIISNLRIVTKPAILDVFISILSRDDGHLILDNICERVARFYLCDFNPHAVINWLEKVFCHENKLVIKAGIKIVGLIGSSNCTSQIITALNSLQFDENDEGLLRLFIETMGPMAAIPSVYSFFRIQLSHDPKIDTYYLLSMLGDKAASPDIIDILINLLESTQKKIYAPACYLLRGLPKNVLTTEQLNRIVKTPLRSSIFAAGLMKEVNNFLKNPSQKEIVQATYSSLNHILQALTSIYESEGHVPQKIFLIRTLARMNTHDISDVFFPILLKLLSDINEFVRQSAAAALISLQYDKNMIFTHILPVLSEYEKFDLCEKSVAYAFICTFIKELNVNGMTNQHVDALINVLNKKIPYVSKAIANVLKEIMFLNPEWLADKLLNLLNTSKSTLGDYIAEIFIYSLENNIQFLTEAQLIDLVTQDKYPAWREKRLKQYSPIWKIVKSLSAEMFTPQFFNVLMGVANNSHSEIHNDLKSYLAKAPGFIAALPHLLLNEDEKIQKEAIDCFKFVNGENISIFIIQSLHSIKKLAKIENFQLEKMSYDCINYLSKLIDSNIDFWIVKLERRIEILYITGLSKVIPSIFKTFLKNYPLHIGEISVLTNHSFVQFFRELIVDGAENLNESITIAAGLFFTVYLIGKSVSCHIKWNDKNYNIYIFSDKDRCILPLTLLQTQLLRRVIPLVIAQADQYAEFLIEKKCREVNEVDYQRGEIGEGLNIDILIQQSKEWPSIETDPILADSRASKLSLTNDSSLEVKSNSTNNKPFSWSTVFATLQTNSDFAPLFISSSILKLERTKKEVFLKMAAASDIVREKLIFLGETLAYSANHLIIEWDFAEGCLSLTFKISDYAIAFCDFLKSQSSGLHIEQQNVNSAQEQKSDANNNVLQYPFWSHKPASLNATQPNNSSQHKESTKPAI